MRRSSNHSIGPTIERRVDPRGASKVRCGAIRASGHLWQRISSPCRLLLLAAMLSRSVNADTAPFDLAGPSLEIKVTRGATTLPVSEVPNLAPGDQLWIRADLPTTQAAHYVMVAAFLRGATNPPPESWFFRCETWTRKCPRGESQHYRATGRAAIAAVLGPADGRGFQDAGECSAGTAWCLRASFAGFEPSDPRSLKTG